VREIKGLLADLGIEVKVVAPMGAGAADLARLHEADFNVVLYPETGMSTALWLQRQFQQPFTRVVPIGVHATQDFVAEVAALAGLPQVPDLREKSRAGWYARSVDSTYLTGKRVFIFGDGSHAIAAARIASRELGFQVVGLGTYSREMARDVRAAAAELHLEALISDDYLAVEAAMAEAAPELVLGTQMERHSAKRLGVPCAVISAPLHVQDVPARYSPVMGFEGANVLFDSWVHPLMMGLEEHLIGMFRHDFEFVDGHRSHLGEGAPKGSETADSASPANADHQPVAGDAQEGTATTLRWSSDGEAELAKIPFFVRPKVKRNTETFALERGIATITDEVLYEAKAHFSR
jgi:light-independent protochlorophyllide reductase subunit B